MRHVRALGFEPLEGRQLLSRAHPAINHPHAAPISLVLDGTLTVDSKAATSTTTADGGQMTSTPVGGVLGSLGKVHGVWNQTVDSLGGYEGPDTIVLRNANGAFGIAFENGKPGIQHRVGHGAVADQLPQKVLGGSGAYARATERGTITLTTNNARSYVTTITLNTNSS